MEKRKKTETKSVYETCKSSNINRVMKLYEAGNLIIRGKKITNQKQAIAIALQQADSNCAEKMKKEDIINIEVKIKNANHSDLRYSDVKRILFLLKYYETKKQYKKIVELQKIIIHALPQIKKNLHKLILANI
jgi:hypothetical protein